MSRRGPLQSIVDTWHSESPVALKTKRVIASVVPERVLLGLKKRYYVRLLRKDSDELMETDARALPLLVRPGDFVVDVGAFVGFYTQRLSRLVGPTGVVWTFEPMPQTFEILSEAVRRLELRNVRLFPYAVSDRIEQTTMEIPRYDGGGESWWDARIVHAGESHPERHGGAPGTLRRVDIATQTLDSVVAAMDRPLTFVKIDAEFHELHCVRGAMATLRRWHPAVQVETLETNDREGSGFRALLDVFDELGYAPYAFDGGRFHPRRPGDTSQNLFFLASSHRHLTAAP